MLYFQYKSLPDEVLEYLTLWEQFSIFPDKAYWEAEYILESIQNTPVWLIQIQTNWLLCSNLGDTLFPSFIFEILYTILRPRPSSSDLSKIRRMD